MKLGQPELVSAGFIEKGGHLIGKVWIFGGDSQESLLGEGTEAVFAGNVGHSLVIDSEFKKDIEIIRI